MVDVEAPDWESVFGERVQVTKEAVNCKVLGILNQYKQARAHKCFK